MATQMRVPDHRPDRWRAFKEMMNFCVENLQLVDVNAWNDIRYVSSEDPENEEVTKARCDRNVWLRNWLPFVRQTHDGQELCLVYDEGPQMMPDLAWKLCRGNHRYGSRWHHNVSMPFWVKEGHMMVVGVMGHGDYALRFYERGRTFWPTWRRRVIHGKHVQEAIERWKAIAKLVEIGGDTLGEVNFGF